MKTYILLLCLSLISAGVFAQEVNSMNRKSTKKLTKQERIAQRKIDEENQGMLVDSMINQHKFVLEANTLTNRYGSSIVVSSRINFIAIDSNKITIQLASNSGIGGANGMGGITTDGTIQKYQVNRIGKDKSGYTISLMTMTSIGSFDIIFSVTRLGYADATITGLSGGKLSYRGTLVPLGQSGIYKGMAI
jgi:hypothetical protein